jgi:hypothetical protein
VKRNQGKKGVLKPIRKLQSEKVLYEKALIDNDFYNSTGSLGLVKSRLLP